jgi:hypothetical protein
MAEIDALKARFAHPFIDPIDIRYRRFETTPKPVAQAVMFCLMDVSGSMTEHMKDLAKRFYMLLYVFLKRRYKPCRDRLHPPHRPRRGGRRGDLLPRPGDRRHAGVERAAGDARHRRRASAGRLEHLRRAGVRRRQFQFRRRGRRRLLTEMILPVSQFFAYLEVGEKRRPHLRSADSSLWSLYQRCAPTARRCRCARSATAARSSRCSTTCFSQRRGKQEKAAP